MFEADVMRLHSDGLTSHGIASRLGLDLADVRAVLSREVVRLRGGAEPTATVDPKAGHNAVQPEPMSHRADVAQTRSELAAQKRAKAEAKRDQALAAIAALQAQLD